MDKKVICKKIFCSLSYTESILYKVDRELRVHCFSTQAQCPLNGNSCGPMV